MNRSFIYGIIVASTTWCFSLYMYWLLTKNSSEISPGSIQWSPSHDSQQYVAVKHNNANGLNQLNDNDDKQIKAQEQKDNLYKRYKKEKKFQKISLRLRDELKPIEVNGGTGEYNIQLNQFFRILCTKS